MLRRIFPAIYSVVVASLLAFIALAVLQFNQINSELEREKVGILASRVAAPFEAAATIGLPLSSVRNASVLLERARQLDTAIEGVFLFGANGALLKSAASPSIDSATLGASLRNPAGTVRTWSGDTSHGYYAGVRILKPDDDLVGGIAIAYSGRKGASQSWAIVGKLLLSGLIFAIIAAPLIWLTLRRSLSGVVSSYDEIDSELRQVECASWLRSDPAGPAPRQDDSHLFGRLFRAAEARYRDAAERIVGPVYPEAPGLDSPATPELRSRLSLTLSAFMALAFAGFSAVVLFAFEQAIEPELESRATVVAELIRSEMQRTLELGIPISALGGLSPYLEGILHDFREISGIAIALPNGETIAEAAGDVSSGASITSSIGAAFSAAVGIDAGTVELPMLAGSEVVGTVQISGSELFIQTRLRDVFLDVSILAIAMLLIGVEITVSSVNASVWKPHAQMRRLLEEQCRGSFIHVMRERGPEAVRRLAARLNAYALDLAARDSGGRPAPTLLRTSETADIRLPLFFFALGAEITASFLPLLAGGASRPPWLPVDLAAAAPLIVYLVCVAALSPFAGALGRRFGPTPIFLYSVPVAFGALVWMAATGGVTQIALARGVVAVGYALATVAAQEYALRAEPAASRVSTMSVFIGLILSGTFCGSVIGGVVASRLGFSTAILLGAVFILAAGATCKVNMGGPSGSHFATPATRLNTLMTRAEKRRLAALLIGLAMPLSAVTAGFIWYYVPVTLGAEGQRPADIARVVMLYYLAAILLGPVVGSIGRRDHLTVPVALTGASLAGLSLLALYARTDVWTTAFVVLWVGAGHALLRSPIYALTIDLGGASTRPVSILRFLERAGALIGLSLAAALSSSGRLASLAPLLGLVTLGGGLLFFVANMTLTRSRQVRHPS
ncbi:MFS transporter [Roseovarius sp.]|uniref:MFS transporter n=1 Tax=Roseovarius sp. TaxID=1486281 RepID=UPI003A982044